VLVRSVTIERGSSKWFRGRVMTASEEQLGELRDLAIDRFFDKLRELHELREALEGGELKPVALASPVSGDYFLDELRHSYPQRSLMTAGVEYGGVAHFEQTQPRGGMNKHCEVCAKRIEGILAELYSARALLVSVVTLSRDAGVAGSEKVDDVLDNLLVTVQVKLSFVDEALREL
jgi:copper chaperone CopZ